MPTDFTDYCSQDFHAIPWFDGQEWVCQLVGEQGPCQEGEWFVLDRELDVSGHLQGLCKPWPCENSRTYWVANFNGTGEGECVVEGNEDACPQGMELLLDPFGDAKCECKMGNVAYVDDVTGERLCYPEYMQVSQTQNKTWKKD